VTAPPLLLLVLLPLLLELLELELLVELPLELLLELLELLLELLELLEVLELLGVDSSLPPPHAASTRVVQSANASARTEARLRWRVTNKCMCHSSSERPSD
jgi:hypothetical protein